MLSGIGPFFVPSAFSQLEQFQFETLRVSNHTACRFAEKTRFFRSLWAGRRCAARKRKNISAPQKERCPVVSIIMTYRRGTAMRALSRAFPFPVIPLNLNPQPISKVKRSKTLRLFREKIFRSPDRRFPSCKNEDIVNPRAGSVAAAPIYRHTVRHIFSWNSCR